MKKIGIGIINRTVSGIAVILEKMDATNCEIVRDRNEIVVPFLIKGKVRREKNQMIQKTLNVAIRK